MQVLEQKFIDLTHEDLANLKPHLGSPYIIPPGTIGVATLVRRIAIKLKRFTVEDAANEDMPLRMFLGMGWEWVAASMYPEMCWQPGEFVHDGIVGHPDGMTAVEDDIPFEPSTVMVEEFKYTWKSIRQKGGKDDDYKSILDEWMWLSQVMGYINILNRGYGYNIRHGRFHICWARGNYTWDAKEKYARYVVKFTEQELEQNWLMLTNERDAA